MKICTFFGHRECFENIDERLMQEIQKLIDNGVKKFYLGNNGGFNRKVFNILSTLKLSYTDIEVLVVLSYINEKTEPCAKTIMADGFETVPRRFAIDHRNKWMVENSDYVICYIRQTYGGAYKFVSIAKRKNKNIIEL